MVAANGVPIRLVQESGNLIELDATSIALTTSRRTGGMPVPFSGGKSFGVDMNLQKRIIVVQGVFTDDKEVVGSDVAASAIIDFTSVFPSGGSNTSASFINANTGTTRGNLARLFDSQNTYVSGSDTLTLTRLYLSSTDGSAFHIQFKKLSSGTTTYSTNGTYIMGINPDSGSITASVLRDALINLVNNEPNLSAKFTASAVNSPLKDKAGAVKIVQDVAGEGGNNMSPSFRYTGGNFKPPYHTDFTGAKTAVKKSAGDKVMDLYGVANNMTRGNTVKTLGGLGIGAISTAAIPFTAGLSTAGAVIGFGLAADSYFADDDYIIGIQIPYNSTIQADGKTYVARNFIMPTGNHTSAKEKGSEGNSLAASADLTKDGNKAGIKGVVQKLDITYEAGENVYGFVLNFAPVEWVV